MGPEPDVLSHRPLFLMREKISCKSLQQNTLERSAHNLWSKASRANRTQTNQRIPAQPQSKVASPTEAMSNQGILAELKQGGGTLLQAQQS